MESLPDTGFVRLNQILGDRNISPPRPPLIPISRATWFRRVKSGLFPAPIRFGARVTMWRAEDIRDLIRRIDSGEIKI